MAGTNIVAARQALIAALRALAVPEGPLEGVKVDYSYVGKYAGANREYIYGGGSSESQVELAAMRNNGRVKREEDPSWSLTLEVFKAGEETHEAGDVRVVALGAVVEDYVAFTPDLGGGVSGLLKTTVVAHSLESYVDDEGSYSRLTYQLRFHSYLD